MARSVARWIGGASALCLLVGLVYLPPRGLPKWARGSAYVQPKANQQRIRARSLAAEWQEANAAAVAARYHDRLGPELADRRSRGRAGPVLALEVDDSLRGWSEPMLRLALDSAWGRLDIGVSKVSVGVIISQRKRRNWSLSSWVAAESPSGWSYLLPDSTDRSTCLVVTSLPYIATTRKYYPTSQLVEWGAGALGPCAYYARFGVPSRRVEQWLARRRFDVALSPSWYRGRFTPEAVSWRFSRMPDGNWWWGSLYSYPYSTMACFSGRPKACRRGIAAADQSSLAPRPRVVVPNDPWDPGKVELIGAEVFLSDLFQETGEERFQHFWTTTLPVDSALTIALHQPVGQYTVQWLRQLSSAPRFGAATTVLDALLGLGVAAALVGIAVLGQGRREVR